MVTTSLRTYNRDIEDMIEAGRVDEAIAHCRHILQKYNKHIDTYRLLGKAFLEVQRHGDAADVLQRVLSSVPGDFTAHIGMSIIREDEGNLDEAIWHMERAFEVQPANGVIQGELRRLYGKRDGLEPPKVRLTRGALARMYVKGELNQQAIGELRAALVEDPQRLDLLILLAQVYHSTGMRVEAADTCNSVLRKLPYCLEANRIMAEIISTGQHPEEADNYRQRLQALDPYYAYVNPAMPALDRVPDQAVNIDRLIYQPQTDEITAQPVWASSLGIELGASVTDQEAVPDWLSQVLEESSTTADSLTGDSTGSEETEGVDHELKPSLVTTDWLSSLGEAGTEENEKEIPDWMKVAGWTAASVETVRAFEASEDESISETDEKVIYAGEEQVTVESSESYLAQADIPDWLRAMAPEGAIEKAQATEPGELAWLVAALAESTPPTDITSAPEPAVEPDTQPVQVGVAAQPMIPEAVDMSGAVEETDLASEIPPIAEASAAATAAVLAVELPEWLRGLGAEEQPPGETTELATETPIPTEPTEWVPETQVETSTLPSIEGETISGPSEVTPETQDMDAAFAWLESLAVKQGATEALLLTPEERSDTPPDWVQEALQVESIETQKSETPQEGIPAVMVGAGVALVGAILERQEEPVSEATPGEPEPEIEPIAVEPVIEYPEGIRRSLPVEAPVEPYAEISPEIDTVEEVKTVEKASAAEMVVAGVTGVALIEAVTPEEKPAPQAEEIPELPDWLAIGAEETAEETLDFAGIGWTPPEIPGGAAMAIPGAALQLDLNKASLNELERLPGIGFVLAQQILSYRDQNGPFQQINDLMNVPGFTAQTLDDIREMIFIEAPLPVQPIAPPSTVLEEAETPIELIVARNSLVQGDLSMALEKYDGLIKSKQLLPDVIRDLKEALYQRPVDPTIWQQLGDAYMRNDQLQEALDAYTKAEELIR